MSNGLRPAVDETPFTVGAFAIDPVLGLATHGAAAAKLSPLGMNVLIYLADRPGRVIARDELLETFWHGPDSANGLHKVIVELRHAFASDGDDAPYIETVRRRGYRLVAPVAKRGSRPRSDVIARRVLVAAAVAVLGASIALTTLYWWADVAHFHPFG